MANLQRIENIFMERLERFRPLLALQEAIVKNTDEIIEISDEQLDSGEDAEGQDMGEYSGWYTRIKGRSSPIDLKDTGSYRDKRYLAVDDKATEIKSRDIKAESLKGYVRRKTGGEPLGISKQNIPKVVDVIKPEMINLFRQTVGVR
jgi:hypothetical protein